MTGIADLYLYMKRPQSKDRRQRFLAHFHGSNDKSNNHQRFVVLAWKRTGSNLLCGMLHHHPEIVMHNELFNPIDIFSYHPQVFSAAATDNSSLPLLMDNNDGEHNNHSTTEHTVPRFTVLTRDLLPEAFLDFVWSGQDARRRQPIKLDAKAVGFKSFPEHWAEVRNLDVFQREILHDHRVKKIILHRTDELSVYVSMLRADQTGNYMTHAYPKDLQLHINPARFQAFLDKYRETYEQNYVSPVYRRDSFWTTYEQMTQDEETFRTQILPNLLKWLGVDSTVSLQKLRETVKQVEPDEDLSKVISNYDELEFCFRYTKVSHFRERLQEFNDEEETKPPSPTSVADADQEIIGEGWLSNNEKVDAVGDEKMVNTNLSTWSILLPICSRGKMPQGKHPHTVASSTTMNEKLDEEESLFDRNRFLELSLASQHDVSKSMEEKFCWRLLEDFVETLQATSSPEQLSQTEIIIGIDKDDAVYSGESAKRRLQNMVPCTVKFVTIQPKLYGKVCKIWNQLAAKAENDFLVLLGDDILLLDQGWQEQANQKFAAIARSTGLPFGAACVALSDTTFPGFPTFPVLHRWHMKCFGSFLPNQFVNQGGDPYVYDLYARVNASGFCDCRLKNTIGGDGDARYQKYRKLVTPGSNDSDSSSMLQFHSHTYFCDCRYQLARAYFVHESSLST